MIHVRILLGAKNLSFSLSCLTSFVTYCKNKYTLYVHEDGSLTDELRAQICEALGPIHFISPQQADELINPLLAEYPGCQAIRNDTFMFKKYFDSLLLTPPQAPLLILDSDILFFRPFKFPDLKDTKSVYFVKANYSTYALYPWHLKPIGNLKIKEYLCAGFIYTRNTAAELPFIENWLQSNSIQLAKKRKPSHLFEQTSWALSKSNFGEPHHFDSAQLMNASAKIDINPDKLVGIHFVGTYRYQFEKYKGLKLSQNTVELKANLAKNLSPFNFILQRLKARYS